MAGSIDIYSTKEKLNMYRKMSRKALLCVVLMWRADAELLCSEERGNLVFNEHDLEEDRLTHVDVGALDVLRRSGMIDISQANTMSAKLLKCACRAIDADVIRYLADAGARATSDTDYVSIALASDPAVYGRKCDIRRADTGLDAATAEHIRKLVASNAFEVVRSLIACGAMVHPHHVHHARIMGERYAVYQPMFHFLYREAGARIVMQLNGRREAESPLRRFTESRFFDPALLRMVVIAIIGRPECEDAPY
ncbi:MAG: hypothetical protein KF742_01665 [Cryobacterium sp.]|nr:hypothetical protein [Cryobacterium sp.]